MTGKICIPEKLIINGIRPFVGKHCETTALKTVLDYHGLSLSEEMLLGLGGGIGFFYWYTKRMPCPFIGVRNGKIPDFLINACRRIGVEVSIYETSSSRKGYQELKSLLSEGEPAIVYGDMVYLPYFALPETAHFGGHTFVVTGLDEAKNEVYIYDRGAYAQIVSITDLARARSSKFTPFPPKHRIIKIKCPVKIYNLEDVIKEAINDCCRNMLQPPINNMGLNGMIKWSQELAKWNVRFQGMELLNALINSFIYIETGGTGGGGFRPMYAHFLNEASTILNYPSLKEVADIIQKSAISWSDIARSHLPDSCPELAKLRELIVKKNELFEMQPGKFLNAMSIINEEIDSLTKSAVIELGKAGKFLYDIQNNILKCRQIERDAFQVLKKIIIEGG